MPQITDKQYAEYQTLRAKAWQEDRKAMVQEELADMDQDEGNAWLDDEAEYRMESGHRDSYRMEG